MLEVELKVLDIDVPAVERRLAELGAVKVFDGVMEASLYDFPGNTLEKSNRLIRVRSKGQVTELTFKSKVPNAMAKSYDELEVTVSDRATMVAILQGLGLRETTRSLSKHRASYALEGVHFELDTIEGLPTFLEIEVSDSAKLEGWLAEFGYALADAKAWAGRDIMRHYGAQYPKLR